MKLLIDTLGADSNEDIFIHGVLKAVKNKNLDIQYTFLGMESILRKKIKDIGFDDNLFTYVNTNEYIDNTEDPIKSIRNKKNSTIVLGVNMLKNNQADAMLSCGNTGALLTAGTLLLGRINNIKRPALSAVLPTVNNKPTIILDVGANVDCTTEILEQFAIMGNIYAKELFGISKPKIALLNIGVEDKKGNSITKDTFITLSSNESINFIGNIEARDILNGNVDVILTDGFSGNIAIKTIEGVANTIFSQLKLELNKTFISKLAAFILKKSFKNMKDKLDYNKLGAVPLLGLKKAIFKSHGSSNQDAIENGIYNIYNFHINNTIEIIEDSLKKEQ